ncbi:membrane protein [Streptococcus pneumoniae]|nr:membrane protein [Streptococcus pneumoniae]
MLLYYTVLSNLLVTIFTLYLLKVMSRVGENWQRPSLLRLKGGVTMSIMITCVIYHFLLAPIATNLLYQANQEKVILILFENLFKPRQFPSATSKHCFEQPAASFLVCSLIFIEYKIQGIHFRI